MKYKLIVLILVLAFALAQDSGLFPSETGNADILRQGDVLRPWAAAERPNKGIPDKFREVPAERRSDKIQGIRFKLIVFDVDETVTVTSKPLAGDNLGALTELGRSQVKLASVSGKSIEDQIDHVAERLDPGVRNSLILGGEGGGISYRYNNGMPQLDAGSQRIITPERLAQYHAILEGYLKSVGINPSEQLEASPGVLKGRLVKGEKKTSLTIRFKLAEETIADILLDQLQKDARLAAFPHIVKSKSSRLVAIDLWQVDKGEYVQDLIYRLGLDPSEVLVLGDSSGDYSMLGIPGVYAGYVGEDPDDAPKNALISRVGGPAGGCEFLKIVVDAYRPHPPEREMLSSVLRPRAARESNRVPPSRTTPNTRPLLKVAVVGSRNYQNLKEVEEFVNSLPQGTIVISGGARGVDRVAEEAARKRGLRIEIYKPDWRKYGKRAGLIRNTQIVNNADMIVAFWDKKSRGTQDTIKKAQRTGKGVIINPPSNLFSGEEAWLGDVFQANLEPVPRSNSNPSLQSVLRPRAYGDRRTGLSSSSESFLKVAQLLETQAKKYHNKPTLIFNDQSISFSQLKDTVFRLANSLINLGIQKGDKVAIYIPNSPEYIYTYLAVWCCGATAVPLDFMLVDDELVSYISDSEAKILIAKTKPTSSLPRIKEKCPALKEIVVCQDKIEGTLSLEDLLEKGSSQTPMVAIQDKDYAVIFYTSGTTGRPKGVLVNYRQLDAPHLAINYFMGLTETDVLLCTVPLSHLGGLMYLHTSLAFGIPVVLMERFVPLEFLKNIQKYRVTCFWIVPSIYYALLQLKEFESCDLSSLCSMIIFGAPSSPDTLRRFYKYCPTANVINAWGMTEISAACMIPRGSKKLASVGKPAPWIEVKIFDENDREVPQGHVGEIVVRSWTVTDGYYKDPDATAYAMRNGWFHTGDLGRLDAEGDLYIVGRLKEMIKVSGEFVYEPEVEAAIHKHPDVAEVAVIGVPHELRGEVPKAFVVLKEGRSLTAEDIRRFCQQHLAHFKVPRYVEFVSSLPKNRAGKIDKGKLRAASTKPATLEDVSQRAGSQLQRDAVLMESQI